MADAKEKLNVGIKEVENGFIVTDQSEYSDTGEYKKYLCSNLGEALTRVRLIADVSQDE